MIIAGSIIKSIMTIEAILRETLNHRDVYHRVKALLRQHHVGD
jgi:hypothetical protein